MPALIRKFNIGLILWVLLSGCQSESQQVELMYFDFKSFIQDQAGALASDNRQLTKLLVIDGAEETVNVQSSRDTAFWKDEFRLFQDLDINRPVLRDAYSISHENMDGRGRQSHYKLKDLDQYGVIEVIVGFDSLDRVLYWESLAIDKNVLYSNKRWARMEMINTEEGNMLKNYEIQGYHKLVLKDTVNYRILGRISH